MTNMPAWEEKEKPSLVEPTGPARVLNRNYFE